MNKFISINTYWLNETEKYCYQKRAQNAPAYGFLEGIKNLDWSEPTLVSRAINNKINCFD
jgi:hypothetical protein